MSNRHDFFSRIAGRVDLAALADRFVVIVGAGAVGSAVGVELAHCGVGHLGFIDGDRLELHNVPRHALPAAYVGTNKAEGLAAHLRLSVPDLDVGALPWHIEESLSDLELDGILVGAHLVVIATDSRAIQRQVARRALALDLPAVIPGMYADRGGEVFVQLGPAQACFLCWDDFRDADAEVRGATSVNADLLAVVQQTVFLALALLDPRSRHTRDLAPPSGDQRPRQLFVSRPGAALLRAPATRRPGCPACAVGPSALNGGQHGMTGRGVPAWLRSASRPRRDVAAGWAFSLEASSEPPIVTGVEVSERLVVEGDTVILSWAARNATHVEVETIGRRSPSGEAEVVLTATRAFRVTAVNPFGRGEALSPVVRAIPLPRLRPLEAPPLPTLGPPMHLARPLISPARLPDPAAHVSAMTGGLELPAWPSPAFPGPVPRSRGSR